jgi:glutamate-5-semialdehyde dehydrogenase
VETKQMAMRARQAAYEMANLNAGIRNAALMGIADALDRNSQALFEANRTDLVRSQADGLATSLLKRLKFDQEKLSEVVSGLHSLVGLPDPIGRTQLATRLDAGLELYRVSCPIGVIGVIFESRPDALVQISGLAVKSGNAILLKGGSEAMETNRLLAKVINEAGCQFGLPDGWIGLMETREAVGQLLAMDDEIDLLIPRGSNEFVRYIMDNTRIPVLGHADGVCHLYIDRACDPEMAITVAMDSKTQYVAVCNAVETILIHSALSEKLLPELAKALRDAGVQIYGCQRTCAAINCDPVSDWHTEYLDCQVSIRLVDSADEAIEHINRYGSGHTEAIVTAQEETARHFLSHVDSGNVFWNCSTRFSDGFRYGFGAEVGISTSKIHARGPVGLDGLMTYQYRLLGHGQIVGEYAGGQKKFIHEPIDRDYPL